MEALLLQYQNEINSIAQYAKTIRFDVHNGNMDDLMKGWIERGRKMNEQIENNKEDVIRIMKQLTK